MRGEVNFQRRHFEFIAGVIRTFSKLHAGAAGVAAQAFAAALARTNGQFDRHRFMEACGVEND